MKKFFKFFGFVLAFYVIVILFQNCSQDENANFGQVEGLTDGLGASPEIISGNNDPTNLNITPTAPASLLTKAKSIHSGSYNSCLITKDSQLVCWGNNSYGQLGDGSLIPRTKVPKNYILDNVKSVAIGEMYGKNCAVLQSGVVKCWGVGVKIGNNPDPTNTSNPAKTPVEVMDLSGVEVASMAVRNHTCVVTAQGGLKCWGSNTNGQVGTGVVGNVYGVPQDIVVSIGLAVASISLGSMHTCALMTNGQVYCWGYNGMFQVGSNPSGYCNGGYNCVQSPANMGINNIKSIVSGTYHSCALTLANNVICWGYNGYGNLGGGLSSGGSSKIPLEVNDDAGNKLSNVAVIAAGGNHTCAITNDGLLWCWGSNTYGELGDGTRNNAAHPVKVYKDALTPLTGVTNISLGDGHTCAIANGVSYCWGRNSAGEIGIGGDNSTFISPTLPTKVLESDF